MTAHPTRITGALALLLAAGISAAGRSAPPVPAQSGGTNGLPPVSTHIASAHGAAAHAALAAVPAADAGKQGTTAVTGAPAGAGGAAKGSDGILGAKADESWVRVGVVAASARGIDGDRPLRFAYRDGERLETMLGSVGQIEPDNLFLLKAEGKDAFLKNLARIGERIAELKAAKRKVFLQFYYSGHGGAKRFHFSDGSLSFDEVKAALGGDKADARVYVLDVCFGASFFNAKGFRTAPPVQLQMEMDQAARGEVTISSSSMDEQAYEVKSLGGSIFTSHWIMALRGAGDRNRDGQVTLFEAYNYAYDRTSGYSAETLDRPQHPSFQMDLTGARDVTLARLLHSSTGILFKGCPAGLYNVVDLQRGIQIGELRIPEGEEFTLALEPGRYRVFYMPGAAGAGVAGSGKGRAPSQAADLELTNASMTALPFTSFQVQTAAQGLPKGSLGGDAGDPDPAAADGAAGNDGMGGMGMGPRRAKPDPWIRVGYAAWAGTAGFEDAYLQKGLDASPPVDAYFGTNGVFPKPPLKSDWGFDMTYAVAGNWTTGARFGIGQADFTRTTTGREPLNSVSESDRNLYPVNLKWEWVFTDTRLGAFAERNFQVTPRNGLFAEAAAEALWRSAQGDRILVRPLYKTTNKSSIDLSGDGYRLEAGLGWRFLLPGSAGGRGLTLGLRVSPYFAEVSGVQDGDGPDLGAREFGCSAVVTLHLMAGKGWDLTDAGSRPGRMP